MKSTGIVRSVDTLGRIVLPKGIRKGFNINTTDSLEIYTDGDSIILKKFPRCICVQCGQRLDETDKYCRYCGIEVKEEK